MSLEKNSPQPPPNCRSCHLGEVGRAPLTSPSPADRSYTSPPPQARNPASAHKPRSQQPVRHPAVPPFRSIDSSRRRCSAPPHRPPSTSPAPSPDSPVLPACRTGQPQRCSRHTHSEHENQNSPQEIEAFVAHLEFVCIAARPFHHGQTPVAKVGFGFPSRVRERAHHDRSRMEPLEPQLPVPPISRVFERSIPCANPTFSNVRPNWSIHPALPAGFSPIEGALGSIGSRFHIQTIIQSVPLHLQR